MPKPDFDYDVISRPAMPPPPPVQPGDAAPRAMASTSEPSHNATRGETR